MGSLVPGATYVYENVDGRVYARQWGSTDRRLIGYESKQQESAERKYYSNHINEVLVMCETDPDMKLLLEKLFVLYNLKKNYE